MLIGSCLRDLPGRETSIPMLSFADYIYHHSTFRGTSEKRLSGAN